MNKPKSQKQHTEHPASDKKDRLAKALRENLLKRKLQKRGRDTNMGQSASKHLKADKPHHSKGEPEHG
ncbi:MAG: hypothetical protein CBC12_12405 [Candidatus Puniceispirillum sp. TMED52]|nr:hypothetical protein [SAR116 cluster bacterium]OUU45722.1 MAG: hypothetical protein CBC12_12405 [Candidatus Puniceispirillum sp. TMED52]|tara:strand:+ start:90 stop:293 length:204 start_codon:yes stop_codon:yes gene_type:complete